MEHWDDVRLFLAVARAGTSRAAARQLGVNQSTVSRRLVVLEQAAGVRLFVRRPTGLQLTNAGRDMLESATRIEEEFAQLSRQVLGRDGRLSGPLRFTLPDFMVGPLGPALTLFGQQYPLVELQVIVENGYANLTHRQADVALRLTGSAAEHLVGRRIASCASAVYGSPAYIAGVPDPADLPALDWIRWEEPWHGIPPERWFKQNVDPSRARAHVNTNLAMVELAAAGLGVGFQLCFTADTDPRLQRISEPFPFGLSLWLLTHDDLRQTSRIRAFMRSIGESLVLQRDRFERPAK